jgi:hypothetical protein
MGSNSIMLYVIKFHKPLAPSYQHCSVETAGLFQLMHTCWCSADSSKFLTSISRCQTIPDKVMPECPSSADQGSSKLGIIIISPSHRNNVLSNNYLSILFYFFRTRWLGKKLFTEVPASFLLADFVKFKSCEEMGLSDFLTVCVR